MGMHIKKFKAASLQEALEKIRVELGDGAIILQTDPLQGAGLLSRDKIEVTAAIDRAHAPRRFDALIEQGKNEMALAQGEASVSDKKPKRFFRFFDHSKATKKAPLKTKVKAKPSAKTSPQKVDKSALKNLLSTPSGTSAPPSTSSQLYAMKTFIEPLQNEVAALKKTMTQNDVSPLEHRRTTSSLEAEINLLRADLSSFIDEKKYEASNLPEHFRKLMTFWKKKGVSEKRIFKLFKDFNQWNELPSAGMFAEEVTSHIRPKLERRIQQANVSQKQGKRIMVLVGPTGVGKTTTIAKLAAREKLKENRSVALVTVDDYKIGGTDQISSYARILKVPFAKPRQDMSLEDQLKFLDADTIYIDTYGVSPFDRNRIVSLRKTLNFSDPELRKSLEVHLTLPVGLSQGDVDTYLHAFEGFRAKYLLFTKWDETSNWGGMLDAIISSNRPVSYIGHGQNVPDDLSSFSSKEFIKTITTVN